MMPWVEILTFEGEVLARLKLVLSDSIEIDEELMAVPTTSLTLPYEYYDVCANGLKRMKIHFNDNVYDGIIFGVDTNNEDGTIDVTLTHMASSWDFRQVPTNKAVKATTVADLYKDEDFIYDKNWTFEFDDKAKEETIDYVYSRQGKLEAITQTMELTQDLWWRIPLNKTETFQIGVFGEDSGYFLSTRKPSDKGIQILSEPSITEDYSSVINLATVYSDKSDGGVTSLSLREVYNDKSLQDEKFPVIIIDNHINNERDYDYANYPKVAPNTQLEYAIMDTESIAMESGYLREGSFAFNDLSPFSIEEVTYEENQLTTKWIVPEEQRYLTEEESFNNYRCIYEFWRGKWSDLAIASFCGAISGESGGNPNIYQNLDRNSLPLNQEGFGLVGWTPYTRCTDWLANHGYQVADYGTGECRKLEEEWNSGTTNAEWIPTAQYPCTWKEWSAYTDKSVEWMVYAWLLDYGRGVWSMVAPSIPKRVDVGNRVLKLIQDEWSKAFETTQETEGSSGVSGDKTAEAFYNYAHDKEWDMSGNENNQGGYVQNTAPLAGQCPSLITAYFKWGMGQPLAFGNAVDYWNNRASNGILNYCDEVQGNPQDGDIGVSSGSNPAFGHIFIYYQGQAFSQNVNHDGYAKLWPLSYQGSIYGYLRPKFLSGTSSTTTTTENEPVDKTTSTIRDEDRIYAAQTVYNAVVKKLINSRRTYQIEIDTTKLPADLQVGMKIKLFYSNQIYKLDKCGNYMKKLLTLNNDFYVTKMTRKLDVYGDETGSLTLEKFIRIDREVQKE